MEAAAEGSENSPTGGRFGWGYDAQANASLFGQFCRSTLVSFVWPMMLTGAALINEGEDRALTDD